MYEELSDKQIKILNYLKKTISDKGYPPTVREICLAVNLKSTSTVHSHLEKLESSGYIRKGNNKNRALEIVDKDTERYDIPKKELSSVPLLGSIAAGMPVLAVENVEDLLPVPVEWLDNTESFALKVKGDSMIDAGIHDGDYVIISSRNVARNGEIVAAIIEDEVTLKTFYKEKDHIRLQPENDDYEPIISRDVKIMGVLKLLIRNY